MTVWSWLEPAFTSDMLHVCTCGIAVGRARDVNDGRVSFADVRQNRPWTATTSQ